MNIPSKLFAKPVLKIGLFLGAAYVAALYIFYFGGKEVILNENLGSAIQLLTIMGLYFGLHHCRRLFPQVKFWQLFLFGIVIIAIAVGVKIVFSLLLYNVFAPDLGAAYKEALTEQMGKMIEGMQQLPQDSYKAATKSMLSPFTIPFLEGLSLLFYGVLFSALIATLHAIFRK